MLCLCTVFYFSLVASRETEEEGSMENAHEQGSEVARILKQIREEYESAHLGLVGLAYGTSQHKVITKKMENIGRWHEELKTLVGDTAMGLIVDQLDDLPGTGRPSVP